MNHKTVVFNEAKMNFDGNLDFSVLSSEVVTYSDTTPDQFLERVADAEILVTKEMPVSREQILALPDSVKLICEAGTGYNNLDLDAAREKGNYCMQYPGLQFGACSTHCHYDDLKFKFHHADPDGYAGKGKP